MDNIQIGVISIPLLIVGIVEAAKSFGLNGKWSQVLALVLGFSFVGLAQAIGQGLLDPSVVLWVELVVYSIAGALSAMGYYDLAKRLLLKG